MSGCSGLATGILVVVIIFHIVFTLVLTALVILVRVYCKVKTTGSSSSGSGAVVHPSDTEQAPPEANDTTVTSSGRRYGQYTPPVVKENEPSETKKADLVLDNQGASEKWDLSAESQEHPRNKTIEELRRESTSSIKKPVSPFRRISSPLGRTASPLKRASSGQRGSGRFSMVGMLHKKSVDLTADPEAVNLMVSPTSSTGERNSEEDLSAENSSHDLIESKDMLALDLEGPDDGPIVILNTTESDTERETDC